MGKQSLLILCCLVMQACIPVKSIFLGQPDEKDVDRFEYHEIQAAEDCFEFHTQENTTAPNLMISDWTQDIPFFLPIDSFSKTHAIRSFVVIQNDTIRYNYLADQLEDSELHSSYSVAKSFTSTLLGIAIDEGKISNVQDLAVDYIPELSHLPESKTLTIEHLLNHTSGIKYNLAADAHLYYGKDALSTLNKISFEHKPGVKQHYLNINIELIGLILYRAIQKPLTTYLEEKIWQPIGMCQDGRWSIDNKNKLEKAYCCIAATALDYAKFGKLWLNEGKWQEDQIFSKDWYNQSINRNTTEGSSYNYNYSWHLGLMEYGDFMAIGLYKQHIYINPNKNLIIVLLNDQEKALKAERVNWWYIFRQIADQL